MRIETLHGVESAKYAHGTVVVVDVFRAATVEAYLLDQGVKTIHPVKSVKEALAYRDANPSCILVGESSAIKIPEFDYGNSPYEISKADLQGKTVIHRSSDGTQGLTNAVNAETLIFGSLVTLGATASYIRSLQPSNVSILDTRGLAGREDDIYAQALTRVLQDEDPLLDQVRQEINNLPSVKKFGDPTRPEFPKEDLELCLAINRFPFLCLVQREGDCLTTTKQNS